LPLLTLIAERRISRNQVSVKLQCFDQKHLIRLVHLACVIMNIVKSIPEHLRPFFWETDLSKINIEENKQYIIERILELGDKDAVQWIFSNFSLDEIKKALKESRRMSKKSLNFWSIILYDQPDA
jgi:hypothetical protein